MRRARGQALLARVLVQLDRALLDHSVGQDGHQQGDPRGEADELHRADGGRLVARPDDDRGVVGHGGQEPAGVLQHLLQLAVGLLEEGLHLLPPGGGQLTGTGVEPGQLVDEEAVALVGRDATGAGVGLDQVPLALEGGHVVADRRRRGADAALPHDVARPDRLGRLDVLLDDGPEDGGFAFVQHLRLALDCTECQPRPA